MDRQRSGITLRHIWRAVLAIIGVVAFVQELAKPADERTWHGKVASFVPYDFRVPTMERVRSTYWNPDGPLFGGKAFGVGWAFNFGALAAMVRRSSEGMSTNIQ